MRDAKTRKDRIYTETKRTKQIQEMWLKAAREEVMIPCGNKASAVNLRFALYNAVKKIRKNPEINPAIADALEVVQASIVGDAENVVRLGRSASIQALDQVFLRLDITGDEAPKSKDEVELAADESLRRLREKMGIDL